MLGIHPGFGGTVRAVRLAGVRTAMEMMLTGKTLRADQARRAGLRRPAGISRRRRSGRPRADHAPARSRARRRLLDRVLSWPLVRSLVQQAADRPGARQGAAGALPCALRHHRPVERATARAAKRPTRPKRAPLPQLMVGETSRNLVRVFLLAGTAQESGRQDASCRWRACTWSARASWVATSPPGARSAVST